MNWHISHRAHPTPRAIADRHYNRQSIGAANFCPPGRAFVLVIPDVALWVTSWPFAEYVKHAWAGAWVAPPGLLHCPARGVPRLPVSLLLHRPDAHPRNSELGCDSRDRPRVTHDLLPHFRRDLATLRVPPLARRHALARQVLDLAGCRQPATPFLLRAAAAVVRVDAESAVTAHLLPRDMALRQIGPARQDQRNAAALGVRSLQAHGMAEMHLRRPIADGAAPQPAPRHVIDRAAQAQVFDRADSAEVGAFGVGHAVSASGCLVRLGRT